MGKMRRLSAIFCTLALAFFSPRATLSQEASNAADVTRRGLFVACDFFISQEDTWPSSSNSLKAVAKALTSGADFFPVDKHNGDLKSVSGFKQAVMDAFGQADDNDISYFYISTHGIYDPEKSNLEAGLLLSDGTGEEVLTARQLQEAFSPIRGTKVLVIDACNSGAFIGKGLSGGAAEAAFLGPDYKVLTSAGGSEESWYWSNTDKSHDAVQGAGYFSSVLSDGLGLHGEYAADLNRDGQVTLTECYHYLLENHAASTPQSYPQEDDFVLFSYDAQKALSFASSRDSLITGIAFYDTVLDNAQNTVSFEFTATRPVRVAYQLVYYRDSKWQFSTAELKYDDQELGGDYGDQPGAISPGRKTRTLALAPQLEDTYGYVMIQLVTIQNGQLTVHSSRVLCVPPVSGDPKLSVKTAPGFDPEAGRELSILVNHEYPCLLSVSVADESGRVVRRLQNRVPTRPQQLTPAGSFFYWNGKLADGSPAAPGKYTVKVTAQIGDQSYEAASEAFDLIGE